MTHSLNKQLQIVKQQQFMNADSKKQAINHSRTSVIMSELGILFNKYSKSTSHRRNPDPVNTQLYVHEMNRYDTLPPILISHSQQSKYSKRTGRKTGRNRNFTHLKSIKSDLIPCDQECTDRFCDSFREQRTECSYAQKKKRKFIQIDMLTLSTNYARNIPESSLLKQHNTKKKITNQIINLPTREAIPEFIKNYKLKNQHLNIDELVRSSFFAVKFNEKESLYFGDIRNGDMDGKGVMITKNWIFEGEWAYNQKYQGVEITQKGTYKGKFVRNQRSKMGEFFWANGEYYSGQWLNHQKHGTGVWKSLQGDVYMGHWFKGKVQGYGIHLTKTGQKYEGFFKNFLKHGQGKEYFPNGDYFEGIFLQGKPNGIGTYKWKNGITYEGEFKDGFREGKGKIKKLDMEYEGQFLKEKADGQGKLVVWNGDNYVGHFKKGKKQGKGIHKQSTWKNNVFMQSPP